MQRIAFYIDPAVVHDEGPHAAAYAALTALASDAYHLSGKFVFDRSCARSNRSKVTTKASALARRPPARQTSAMILVLRTLALLSLILAPPAQAAPDKRGPLVLAAASMQEAMTAAAGAWAAKGHPRPILSFAGSSALARQIRAGAPADLFLSADEAWMADVERGGFVVRGTRANIAGNQLVLVTPSRKPVRLRIARGMAIGRALGHGRIAMANPDAVPAGKYGKAALIALGVWPQVANRIARGENVRTALALVERGEAPLGIVYATDARAASNVTVVGTFPSGSHPPIRYPLARLTTSRNGDAEAFRRFLLSDAGKAILVRYGFTGPR